MEMIIKARNEINLLYESTDGQIIFLHKRGKTVMSLYDVALKLSDAGIHKNGQINSNLSLLEGLQISMSPLSICDCEE